MSLLSIRRQTYLLLALAGLLGIAGCNGIPRIDPSGRQLFITPNPNDPSTQTTFESPFGGPSGGGPFGSAPGPASNNQLAPPVLSGSQPASQPLCPLCPLGQCLGGNNCLGGCLSGEPLANAVTTIARKPNETLTITPERVLAPIGSEVILKASVCGQNNYLRTNRRIEWMLGNQGAGQFVTVGEQGEMDILRFPWQRPNKHDNTFAVGYTSPFHTCINRGTPDRTDDLQIRPGDAWITVTSASEGVSFVTASAPETDNWETRRARATIYWVDAQWVLPPSTSVQLGQSHTLVTTVTRKSDGAPVQGWSVEYEVLEGPTARLGYEAGQASNVTTDAQGRASIEVSPTDDQPGMARIKVNVVRPPTAGSMPSPRLDIGGGETVINWTPSASAPVLNEPVLGGDSPAPPAPFEPTPTRPTPPINPNARPQLDVKLTRDTQGIIKQGDSIPVTITVINTGEAIARDISVTDRFEAGLTSPFDTERIGSVTYPAPGSPNRFPDLGPGESDVVRLELQALSSGRQCHEVTVTAAGTDSAFDRQCFDVQAPAAPVVPKIELEAQGDLRREVNDIYLFKSRVFNRGSVVAKNVRVQVVFDGPLEPIQAETGYTLLDNGFSWEVGDLEAGGSIPFNVQFRCLAATRAAKVTAYAKADGVSELIKNAEVEIVPAANAVGPITPNNGAGSGPAATGPIAGQLLLVTNPARVGFPGSLDLRITNTTNVPQRNVEFRLVDVNNRLSIKLTPAQSNVPFSLNQNTIQFGPLPELAAGQSVQVTVPYDAISQGLAPITLETRVNEGQPVQVAQESLTVDSR